MKEKQKGVFKPNPVDRAVFASLSFVCLFNGFYLVSPWYLETRENGSTAPLYNLFNSHYAVTAFGLIIFVVGVALVYAAIHKGATRLYTKIVSTTLLSGFLVRLYSTIGVLLTIESWRPPSYLSQIATVLIFGSYWVWVNVNARTIKQ